MINFGDFRKPEQRSRPNDPRDIFRRRPAGEGAANDLWQGQAEALGRWYENRKDDSLILLNTGAGKTIIGLLIAQSYVNQGVRNVVYVCSTVDLIHQTAREARKLGLPFTCRFAGRFDNDLFSQGRAFCVTTYSSLLNPRNVFKGSLKAGAIIFDDAHVANRIIRDSFSLHISKSDRPKTYDSLIELVRSSFSEVGLRVTFQASIREDSSGSVLLVPPTGFFDVADKVTAVLDEDIKDDDTATYFPWLLIREKLKYCACFIRKDSIEICPPFIPTLTLQAFARDVKRVYLSATLATQADFNRVFGRSPQITIAPNVDAGDGERLFLFASKFENGRLDKTVVEQISDRAKVLIAVPSRARAAKWTSFAALPAREDFTQKLDEFRSEKRGAFLLVSRFDGIDLPGSQCRIMAIDGLPAGVNLIEQFLFESLQMDHFQASSLSVRLTQLLGRIIRGRQDFGLFLIADRHVENWLKNERNRALLPELLRRQLFLSESIESEISKPLDINSVAEFAKKIINRAEDWVDFYADNINEIDVPPSRIEESEEADAVLSNAGRAEVRFMTKIWDGDLAGARRELEPLLREVAIHDALLAGWYSVWIGMAYYAEGKTDAAFDLFDEARLRIGRSLPLPRRQIHDAITRGPATSFFEEALREVASGNVVKVNDKVAKLSALASDAFLKQASHKKCEEAVRAIGAALGFSSSRPCNEYGLGPDNLWIDILKKRAIAFELKTDKDLHSQLTKGDIGQGFNHIEWVRHQYPEIELLGLIYLTDCRRFTDKCSPANNMYFGSQARLRNVWDDFLRVVELIRPRTELERVAEAKKLGALSEWAIEGIFQRIWEKKLD